jgi:hypothetical protein
MVADSDSESASATESLSLLELLKTRKRARETGGNGPSCRDLRDAQAARPVALARLSATAAEVRVSCNLK